MGRDQCQLSVPEVPLGQWGLVLQLGCFLFHKDDNPGSHFTSSSLSYLTCKGEEIPKPAFLVGQHLKRQMGACPSGAKVSWQVELELHDWRQFLSVSLLLTYCLMGLCPDFESI